MADFVDVLKKTLKNLGETTYEVRQRLYTKAREAVESHLKAMVPPLPQHLAEERRRLLEEAIAEVEKSYSSVNSTPDLHKLISSSKPFQQEAWLDKSEGGVKKVLQPSREEEASLEELDKKPRSDNFVSSSFVSSPKRKVLGFFKLIFLMLFAFVAGISLVLFKGKELSSFVSSLSFKMPLDNIPLSDKSNSEASIEIEEEQIVDFSEEEGEKLPYVKFSQRLQSDGTEIDTGSVSSPLKGVGEGSSSASPTIIAPSSENSVRDESNDFSTKNAFLQEKAIFYEESKGTSDASVTSGSIHWSLVQEPPAPGLSAEPAIRGDALISDKGLRLRMTIRRNADRTLPASHIIEMIFVTSGKKENDSIDNVVRVSLKGEEQDTGFPLSGIPAKISDGFFLVALDDTKKESQKNLDLLTNKQWIDIPMVYKSGQRALITVEKGSSGNKIFSEALNAWQKILIKNGAK